MTATAPPSRGDEQHRSPTRRTLSSERASVSPRRLRSRVRGGSFAGTARARWANALLRRRSASGTASCCSSAWNGSVSCFGREAVPCRRAAVGPGGRARWISRRSRRPSNVRGRSRRATCFAQRSGSTPREEPSALPTTCAPRRRAALQSGCAPPLRLRPRPRRSPWSQGSRAEGGNRLELRWCEAIVGPRSRASRSGVCGAEKGPARGPTPEPAWLPASAGRPGRGAVGVRTGGVCPAAGLSR